MTSKFNRDKFILKRGKKQLEELYKISVEIQKNESHTLLQSHQSFLIGNTILLAAISQVLFNNGGFIKKEDSGFLVPLVLSIMGIVVCFLWLMAYLRRNSYYNFRVAQTRQREPEEWNIITGDGRIFAQGGYVEIEDLPHHLNYILRFFNPKVINILFMISFVLLYLVIICLLLST